MDAAIGGVVGLIDSQILFTPDPVALVSVAARRVLDSIEAALRGSAAGLADKVALWLETPSTGPVTRAATSASWPRNASLPTGYGAGLCGDFYVQPGWTTWTCWRLPFFCSPMPPRNRPALT
ncbi:hypothetical protein [Arthrobacter sp. H35-D1]|uniref:hypothetical protein n=1 Tax=Arthrobacter sp. H35-D1 TaxID=3046202 RepID=UPI0024BA631D|nr:hypothetical protein [Arthrobacter sp. H35-D1]MDJ0314762.1 hypothetical protein [Arthrobacter sp. H35-D1]